MICLIICVQLTSLNHEDEHPQFVNKYRNRLTLLILPPHYCPHASWHGDDGDGGVFFDAYGDFSLLVTRMISYLVVEGLQRSF